MPFSHKRCKLALTVWAALATIILIRNRGRWRRWGQALLHRLGVLPSGTYRTHKLLMFASPLAFLQQSLFPACLKKSAATG